MVSFSQAIRTCAKEKYATCKGRATRAEYWWWTLFNYIVLIGFIIVAGLLAEATHEKGFYALGLLPYLYFIIPNICVLVRRLHDTGHSGWAMCFSLIPYVGGIIVFVFTLLDSDPDNQYGPNPHNSSFYYHNNYQQNYPPYYQQGQQQQYNPPYNQQGYPQNNQQGYPPYNQQN